MIRARYLVTFVGYPVTCTKIGENKQMQIFGPPEVLEGYGEWSMQKGWQVTNDGGFAIVQWVCFATDEPSSTILGGK